ncbi:MAG: hypothetical protein IM631_13105 [Cytophagales bacterium]|jgi:hypothetical protein|nr:hypothetical protein [Cytophagales bacterium]MCA6372311.1 hypothetical protein [Cytophagales bacterium]MCA6382457.1 hypothetical protein [Cytophagales bacterium]
MITGYIHIRNYILGSLFVIFICSSIITLVISLFFKVHPAGIFVLQCIIYPVLLISGIVFNNKLFAKDKTRTDIFTMENHLNGADYLCIFVNEFEKMGSKERLSLIQLIFGTSRFVSFTEQEVDCTPCSFYSNLNNNEKDLLLNYYKETILK